MTLSQANTLITLASSCLLMGCFAVGTCLIMSLYRQLTFTPAFQPVYSSRTPSHLRRYRLQELAASLSNGPRTTDLPGLLLNPLQRANAYITILSDNVLTARQRASHTRGAERALAEMVNILRPLSSSTPLAA